MIVTAYLRIHFDIHLRQCREYTVCLFVVLNTTEGRKAHKRDKCQGPRSKFSSGGAKEESVKENFLGGARGHACGFLFNFSKATENANNDKTIDFFPHLQ